MNKMKITNLKAKKFYSHCLQRHLPRQQLQNLLWDPQNGHIASNLHLLDS